MISSTTPMIQREYEQYFNGIDQNQQIVYFITDDLSPEDLSIKNEHNRKGFQNLATGVSIVEYIPYVENAADNKVTMDKKCARTTIMSTNELHPTPSDTARIVIVSLPKCDESESRYHCMARIDRACYALTNSDEYKDALFVLTSQMNSHLHEVHSRRARDTSAQSADGGHKYPSKNALVYFKNLMERPRKGTKDAVIDVSGVTTSLDGNTIRVDIQGKYPMELYFTVDDMQYWTLNASKSKVNSKPIDLQTEVSSSEEFSFSCVSSVYFKFDKESVDIDGIYFQNLQLQLSFTNTGGNIEKFLDSNDCVGFTSPAIWAGLFITFLLLSIISTAITYIMDIRTMDRFDDPKGKTITINASE